MGDILQSLGRFSGTTLLILFMGVFCSAQESKPAKPDDQQLQNWLAELDDDAFDVREAATQHLAQAGPAAIDSLASGVVSDSAEIAWRSGAALERIALTGDEKTLTRVTSILDGLSVKGKPGLKSMAAEMHIRQKRFRHDRAVASLKQNGAVFADEGMELGGGPIFIGGGPIAIAMDAVPVEGPIIMEEEIAPPIEAPEAPGFFGLLGRILDAVKIPGEPAPKLEIEGADPAPPAEAPPVEDVAEPKDLPAPEKVEAPAEEAKVAEPAQTLEEFQELSKPPIPEEPAAPPPPATDGQFVAPPPDLPEPAAVIEEGAIVAGDIGVAVGFDVIGGEMIDVDGEGELESTASLVLGAAWRGGDEGLKVLKDVPEIMAIAVDGARITDASLQYFADLPNLSTLQVRGTDFTRQGLQKLRQQKPELQVQARGEAIMGVNADIGESPLTLTSVFPDSGAYQAGLREGDIIMSVDGMAIKEFSDLTISVYGRKPGDTIRVEYERESAKKSVMVTLKKRGDDQ